MRKTLLSLTATAAVAVIPIGALAQSAPAAAPSSPHTLTGNVGLFSDYRFRGLTQTMRRPALQGGFDYAHSSGFYVGNWNSNVSSAIYPNANLEMDFYGGYKKAFGDFGLDLGAIYYYYPGSLATLGNPNTGGTHTGKIDNKEIYVGGSWKWLSLKYYHAIDDLFSVPDTKNSFYLDGTATVDLGGGWGVIGHLGRQKVRRFSQASYTDWKLGVTKDVNGFVLGVSYVDTNADPAAYTYADARRTMNIGRSGLVFSVSKTF